MRARIPLWLKAAYTAYVAVLVPAYAEHYGPGNFLWFSDVALLLGCVAIWLEHPLLAGTQAIAVLVPDVVWTVDFAARAAAGVRLTGMTDYMFDPVIPFFIRALSLFHVWLPVVLLWMVFRLGYDARAFRVQAAIGTVVLIAAYVLTGPDRNINLVHRWGAIHAPWSLALSLAGFPCLVFWPAHRLLRATSSKPRESTSFSRSFS
jgi:hypothetical protein